MATENQGLSPLHRALAAVERLKKKIELQEQAACEPIAIVGLGCRFPGGRTPEEFWQALDAGVESITNLDAQRWMGRSTGYRAGLIDSPRMFDAAFFGISPREAQYMDPQQRLLLEVSWEALEDAGCVPADLKGSKTGVYIGASTSDYQFITEETEDDGEAYRFTGNLRSLNAGRISYALGLEGPSMMVDTSCSSALVAVHLAVQSLRSKECDVALAGGVNLILRERTMDGLARTKALSLDGKCRVFDHAADGFVRGEGCGVVVLKRLQDAVRNGDRIWGCVAGSAVNQDGHSQGLTVPNGRAQATVVAEALKNARIDARDLSLVEAHGTGTKVGDPIELAALRSVLDGAGGDSCAVTSIKANVGHLESAAGICSIIKVLLCFAHRRIPRQINFDVLNPMIDLRGSRLQIPTRSTSWEPRSGRRVAGVSGFGMSGTNAHVVLYEAPATSEDAARGRAMEHGGPSWLTLSARSEAALDVAAARLSRYLERSPNTRLEDVAYTLARRTTFKVRRRLRAEDVPSLRGALERSLGVSPDPRDRVALAFEGRRPPSWADVAACYATWPELETWAEEVLAALNEHATPIRRSFYEGAADADRTSERRCLAAVAHEIVFGKFWLSCGLQPRSLLGMGLGALSCVAVSGAMALHDVFRVVALHGRLVAHDPVMREVAVLGPAADLDVWLGAWPEIRTIERRNETLRRIAVPASQIPTLLDGARRRGITMSVNAAPFEAALFEESSLAALRASVADPVRDPSHPLVLGDSRPAWADRVARAVACEPADVARRDGMLAEQDVGQVVMAARGSWVPRERFAFREARSATVPSLPAEVRLGLAELHDRGGNVQRETRAANQGRVISLPTYPFERTEYWLPQLRPCLVSAPSAPEPTVARLAWVRAQDIGDGELASTLRETWLVLGTQITGWESAFAARGARLVGISDADEIARYPEARGVLIAWSTSEGGESPELRTAMLRRSTAALRAALLQVRGSLPHGTVWIVTRRGTGEPGDPVDPTAASAWGLGRIIESEFPRIWGGLVDLDPQDSMETAASTLLRILQAGARDGQKVVRGARILEPRLQRVDLPKTGPVALDPVRAHVISGGTGALGLRLARWLVARGARHLVLFGRSGRAGVRDEATVTAWQALRDAGVRIDVEQVDVGDRDAVAELFARLPLGLASVFHLAGVARPTPAEALDEVLLREHLHAKAIGAAILDELTRPLSLQYFVVFSSAAAILGGPGQGAYAMANAYADAIIAQRVRAGYPGLSIGWGMWSSGMATEDRLAGYRRSGMFGLCPDVALAQLDRLLQGEDSHAVVTATDWVSFRRSYTALRPRRMLDELASPEPNEETAAPLSPRSIRDVRKIVVDLLSKILRLPEGVEPDASYGFTDLGMDSLMAVELRDGLQQAFGRAFESSIAFDYPTIERLSAYLAGAKQTEEEDAKSSNADTQEDTVAIIGVGCRLPGGVHTPEAFWQLLVQGRDPVGPLGEDRRRRQRWPDGGNGGFLDRVDTFDPAFFNISAREAETMDPQQRLALTVAWEALEHANVPAGSLRQSKTGVYVGVGANEYRSITMEDLDPANAFAATGNQVSAIAGRVSYALGLEGPSMSVDTACSSSLVAIVLAMRALSAGDADLALAGGVNVILDRSVSEAMVAVQAVSKTGRCRTFDAEADGYVRSEGCVVFVLKRTRDAVRDGDAILAVLRGGAINHDGASSGLTVPHGPAQQKLIRAALKQAGVGPDDIDYIEAHGTGTALGDPIEAKALDGVFHTKTRSERLRVGSLKANIGHAEAAAGAASVLKVVLGLTHKVLPAQLHFSTPSPRIDWEGSCLRVIDRSEPWERHPDTLRTAGVSAFGISGTNAHLIVQEGPPAPALPDPRSAAPLVLVVSGPDEDAVQRLAAVHYEGLCASAPRSWSSYVRAMAAGRQAFKIRAALVVESQEEAHAALAELARREGDDVRGWQRGNASSLPRVALWFADGGLCPTACRDLYARSKVFRTTIDALDPTLGHRLRSGEAFPPGALVERVLLQLAMVELWRSWGLDPAVTTGVGSGELVALAATGARDATWVRCVLERGTDGTKDVSISPGGLDAPEAPRTAEFVSPRLGWRAGDERESSYWTESRPAFDLAAWRSRADVDLILFVGSHRQAAAAVARDMGTGAIPTWLFPIDEARGTTVASLDVAARLFVRGTPIRWEAVFPSNLPNTRIPTYPFRQDAFWVRDGGRRRADDPPPWLGPRLPVLGQRIDLPAGEVQFVGHLSTQEQPFLADHLVLREIVVPGAFHISLLLFTAFQVYGRSPVAVDDVSFSRVLPLRSAAVLSVRARPDDAGRFAVEISSRRAEGGADVSMWRVHARGTASAATSSVTTVDLEAIRARCRTELSVEHLYEVLDRGGIGLGPTFRWMTEVHAGDGEALVRLEAPGEEPSDAVLVHPGLMDSLLQSITTVAERLVHGVGVDPFIPFAADRALWHGTPAGVMWAYVRKLHDTDEVICADVSVVDERGRPCFELRGATLKRAPRDKLVPTILERAQDPAAELRACVRVWKPNQGPGPGPTGRVRVLHTGGVIGRQWIRELTAKTVGVESAPLEDVLNDPALLQHASQAVEVGAREVCVVLLEPPRDEYEEVVSRCMQLIALVRILTAEGRSVGRMLLAVPGEDATSRLWSAPLEGLVRVIQAEHPELSLAMVWLGDAHPIDDLVVELTQDGNDEVVAYRGGRRHVARLEERPFERRGHTRGSGPCTYLLTGGLGALGRITAQWLLEGGVERVVLMSRRPDRGQLGDLAAYGTRVEIVAGDVADMSDVRRAIEIADSGDAPLRGVFHMAGLVDDALLPDQHRDRFTSVTSPKIRGAWNLHVACGEHTLDAFVMYSSLATILGSPGQGNYAAANAFLDALAEHRHAHGKPALSIDWGPWAGGGMADQLEDHVRRRWLSRGVSEVTAELGCRQLQPALSDGSPVLGLFRVDWTKFLAGETSSSAPQLLEAWHALIPREEGPKFADSLHRLSPTARRARLVETVDGALRTVVGLSASKVIDPETTVSELGIDSVLAVEVRNELTSQTGLKLPATLLFDYTTIGALADHLEKRLGFTDGTTDDVRHSPPDEELDLRSDVDRLSEDELLRELALETADLSEVLS